ncbi:MAG TPA: phosphatase PAP2 family protein [Patescibacteria group bacterium]|nr:phosphatase PAP2 family protein [Patescibacteria group bacterium]
MHSLLSTITDLGDPAILLPLTLVGSLYFAVAGWRASAVVFLGAVGATGLLVAGLKMLLIGCGPVVPLFHIRSPSGHVAMSAVVYGLLAQAVARPLDSWRSRLVGVGALVLIMAIGASRVRLGFHSWQEVVAGGVLGAGVLAVCRRYPGIEPSPQQCLRGLALLCLPVIVLLNGVHLPVEHTIRQYAGLLRSEAPICLPKDSGALVLPSSESPGSVPLG